MLSRWGEQTKPLPESVCTNLTQNVGWTMLTETSSRLPVGEESIIELDLEAVPTSKREEEVNQEEAEETLEDQLGDEEICQETGRIRIIPDASLNEPDTESMRNARNMNTHLDEDALSDISEVSEQ